MPDGPRRSSTEHQVRSQRGLVGHLQQRTARRGQAVTGLSWNWRHVQARRHPRLALAARQPAVDEVAQATDDGRMADTVNAPLELGGSERPAGQAAHQRDHPILGQHLQRARSKLISLTHAPRLAP
jgi:hypothetical protein